MEYQFIVSAYYHSSEHVYAFGPFKDEAAVVKFMDGDKNPDSHEPWDVTVINKPKVYGTGHEYSSH